MRTEAELWAHMGFSVQMWGKANWKALEGNRPSEILALFYVPQQNCEVGEVILTLFLNIVSVHFLMSESDSAPLSS